jgi:uncharacterized protein with PIN domain
MSRIRKAYETRFVWLLRQVGARRLGQGVEWLVEKARRLSVLEKIPLAEALTRTYDGLAVRPRFRPVQSPNGSIRFFCDAGLGGLARWLRAAGYEAEWEAGIDDDVLLQKAREISATLLTTDSMLMERRLLRDRILPSFWLPPTLNIPRQLELVFREFRLETRPPRCMSCGGELRPGDKEQLKERIPPRTYRWLDEFFVCTRCGKLFWHGTHWHRIMGALERLKVEG